MGLPELGLRAAEAAIYAGLMHLISPAFVDVRLPSATWAVIGPFVGVGLLTGLTVTD